jgi:capsular exopolysaccharide synthesis family protein
MTTLPQTTPIRLPRPAGPSQLAVPTAPAAAVASAGPSIQMTGADIWRVIRANLWLIALFVVASVVAGYYINGYLEKHFSRFTATGIVRISPLQQVDLTHPNQGAIDNQSLVIEQKTDAHMIQSDGLIYSILSQPDSPIRDTTWFKDTCASDPAKARKLLSEKLTAQPLLESRLIQVTMTASNAKDTATIIKVVVDEAIKETRDRIRHAYEADSSRLSDEINRQEAEWRRKDQEAKDLASQLFEHGAMSTNGVSQKELELQRKVEAQIQMQENANAAANHYDTFMAALQRGEVPSIVDERVNQDVNVVNYRQALESVAVQLDKAQRDLGSANPAVKSLQDSHDLYQHKYDDAKAEKTSQFTEEFKVDLANQKDATAKSLTEIEDQVQKVKNDMAQLGTKKADYESLRMQQERLRDQINQGKKALDDMAQMVRQVDFSSMDWAQLPQEPDSPSFPTMLSTMSVAIGLGLMLSLGIAFLREVTDTTVRSPRDIQRVGQMNLLGMVPHEADDPQSSGARLPLVIFEAPHSIMAEQFRQVRTRLQHAASLDTTRSILVTSPSPGDGKSTIAVNLAAGLALNGRRILLVDANFRRPELHRIFGVGNEAGFSNVLNDVNAFDSSVRETSVPNLSVMPSGPKPSNPTELLESQLLLDFIERALEEYDHVIFDSGPMLFVSDSVALAPRVDGVVTVVKARTSTRGVLQRMREGLRQVKAEHLGIVLNGVRSQAGGYYGRSIKTYYEYQNAG